MDKVESEKGGEGEEEEESIAVKFSQSAFADLQNAKHTPSDHEM